MSETPHQRLGDYEILNELGAGGMGRVYRVRNVLTDRIEAMKVLLPDLQGHEEVAARFLREIKVLAALNHPNIASLQTALTIGNQLVMIMEFVEGRSLASRLDAGAIPASEALGYLDQVLDALSYAHRHHVIHRDIKPANMMVTRQGVVKLMDFGIAHTEGDVKKLTATGSTLGSISYMSPEQVKGEPTDERSDLYSLGISLYEMVTGRRPFDVGSSFSIMAAHINQAPQPPVELHPGLPAVVNDLILTSIAKLPSQRFQTADAFRKAALAARGAVGEEGTMVQGSMNNTIDGSLAPTASNPAWPSVPAGANDRTMVQGSSENTIAGGRTMVQGSSANTIASTPTASSPAVPAAAKAPKSPAAAYKQTFAAAPAPPPPAPSPSVAATGGPTPPPPAAAAGSHRGMYMALGALVVVVALVAAGLYMPGHKKASASDAVQTPPAQQTVAPTQTSAPAPTPVPAAAPTSAPAPSVDTQAAARAKAQRLAAEKAAAEKAAAEQAAAAQRKADLDAVEHRIDQLTGRAGAVNASLNNLQRQQAAAGYGLRGDMASAQSRMNLNLQKAQGAIQAEDLDRARRYAAQTESDLETLEKFLGR